MVEIVGAKTAVHFSPKDLGLNVGFFRFLEQPGTDFLGLFSNSPY